MNVHFALLVSLALAVSSQNLFSQNSKKSIWNGYGQTAAF